MNPIGIVLGKQPSTRPLPFKDVLRVAELLAERLQVLREKLPHPHYPRFDTKRVLDIHAALKAIDATPNGSVSRETLDEWIGELCSARDQLGKWCSGLMTFCRSDHDVDDLMDDEIPF